MKAAALIMLALLIDGVQAALSAALAIIAAFPGTIAGGVGGCLAGNYLLGDWGCTILGLVGGFFGTALDAAALVTEPVGLALGFVMSICLSVTFGAGLMMLLMLNGMYYPKFMLPSGIAEMIPGFDLIPTWTAMTILCVVQKIKDDKISQLSASIESTDGGSEVSEPAPRIIEGIRAPEPQTNAA